MRKPYNFWLGLGVFCAIACTNTPNTPTKNSTVPEKKEAMSQPLANIEMFRLKDGTEFLSESSTLSVPENRSKENSQNLALRFVRISSTSSTPRAPIVFLAGGPGDSGVRVVSSMPRNILQDFLSIADVIAFDQRGTGKSEPQNIQCDVKEGFSLEQSFAPKSYRSLIKSQIQTCLKTMASQNIDILGLTTEESADDLEALRLVLGVERISLFGSSYGTHLALSVLRRHPHAVENMVLAGVEGPNHTLKSPKIVEQSLLQLETLIKEDPYYQTLLPNPLQTLYKIAKRLEKEPVRVSVSPETDIVLGSWDLYKTVADAIGHRQMLQRLPKFLVKLSSGDFSLLARLAYQYRSPKPIHMMKLAMDCASFGTSSRIAQIREEEKKFPLGATINFPLLEACATEGLPRLDDSFRTPIVSEIPVLLISGTLDGRTPVQNAEEVAKGLSKSQHLIVERGDHGVLANPSVHTVIKEFLIGQLQNTDPIEGPSWIF